jgi:hypothetical protein
MVGHPARGQQDDDADEGGRGRDRTGSRVAEAPLVLKEREDTRDDVLGRAVDQVDRNEHDRGPPSDRQWCRGLPSGTRDPSSVTRRV